MLYKFPVAANCVSRPTHVAHEVRNYKNLRNTTLSLTEFPPRGLPRFAHSARLHMSLTKFATTKTREIRLCRSQSSRLQILKSRLQHFYSNMSLFNANEYICFCFTFFLVNWYRAFSYISNWISYFFMKSSSVI